VNSKLQAVVDELVLNGIKLEQALGEFERRYIQAALNGSRGNRSLAARNLGIHRNTLAHKIRHHRLPRKRT
jgi:Fis family transcriptional regulator, factor for inversion stimulation protein